VYRSCGVLPGRAGPFEVAVLQGVTQLERHRSDGAPYSRVPVQGGGAGLLTCLCLDGFVPLREVELPEWQD
jgi:hypothetical protein